MERPPKNRWRFMDHPPKNGGGSWIALEKSVEFMDRPPARWLFMDRPRKNGVASWIAPENLWRFMDRPPEAVAVHGSPSKTVAVHGSHPRTLRALRDVPIVYSPHRFPGPPSTHGASGSHISLFSLLSQQQQQTDGHDGHTYDETVYGEVMFAVFTGTGQ